jgi:hypothetical protein
VKAKDGGAAKLQNPKKWKGVPLSSIVDFFSSDASYSTKDHVQIRFIKNLMLHVVKSIITSKLSSLFDLGGWVMKRNQKVKFPTCRQFVLEHLLNMVAKTMYRYVLPLLVKCETKGITFDL